jgi:GDP-mannose 6-dehydrogenase
MKVTIFGLGYVGCVTSACLAECGHEITGIDVDANKIALIKSGRSPLIEPGLDDLISKGIAAGRLTAAQDFTDLGDISFISVGTPSNPNGSLCLDHVVRVAARIGDALKHRDAYHVVNVRSTVLPGTVENVVMPILQERSGKTAGKDFGLCMNPEFLRETTAVHDFHHPPFTVVGGIDDRSIDTVSRLYEKVEAPIERTSLAVAEMIKYTCNAFHALKVVFGNEIGLLAKSLNVDSHRVMDVFCKDGKLNLSPYYLKPGFAFGGSCLPKDLRAMLHKSKQHDLELPMLNSLLDSNRRQIEHAFNLVTKAGRKKVGVLGLSFKAGTDDLRESPIVILIEMLIGKGYNLAIYDEEVSLSKLIGANRRFIESTIPHISSLMVGSVSEVFERSEVIIVSKKNKEFQDALAAAPSDKKVIDLVRIPKDLSKAPANYEGICW